ncbi:hypothetical protein BT96DRAFT_985437 [Gymnopus androsaceus JB14]|uniref:Uncharacterized protein n=1 Tax=Gymnopus androsaceus JB14 TaxID=1447944 RepID=A0A6A4ID68_9AGAR|nr:hypothetical protein BT96DRAFT_985437 [Gymnopus androsaceus JB14]
MSLELWVDNGWVAPPKTTAVKKKNLATKATEGSQASEGASAQAAAPTKVDPSASKRLLSDDNNKPSMKKACIAECCLRSLHTGHLNVIMHNDMICIMPCTQIPPELALIDCTLEELEADEPDWDMPWHRNNSKISPSPSSSPSISFFSSRTSSPLPSSSAPLSQPSPSSLPVSTWPLGLTVAHMLAAFSCIFDNESSLLSP